jgi:hypothetical protein
MAAMAGGDIAHEGNLGWLHNAGTHQENVFKVMASSSPKEPVLMIAIGGIATNESRCFVL